MIRNIYILLLLSFFTNIWGQNDAPVTTNVNGSGNEGGTITTTLTATDTDSSDPATFTFSILSMPTNITGSVTYGGISYSSGTFTEDVTYTHDGSETTSDSLTYKANDGIDNSNISTANITITAVNDAPVASAVNGSGENNNIITTTLIATDVDDTDPNNFFIIVSQPTNSNNDDDVVIGTPSYSSGTFTAVATYTHDGSQTTSDSFTYKANDGDDYSDTATATITITDEITTGCTDPEACNYDETATEDDGSCEYYDPEIMCDCDETFLDVNGDCCGYLMMDECGVCNGDNSACEDCAGVPNGDAVEDECGVCGGDGSTCELDCDSEVCLAIDNVDIDSGTLDIYITNSEPVWGFQFELLGITILGITGGSASQYLDFVEFNSSVGSVLGVSFIGNSISPGSSLLITISFTDYLGSDICFGTNTNNNMISDSAGFDLDTDWGACYCDPSNPEDECGVCGGPGASYECGCNDISTVDNDTENIITITSYSWFEDLHYDFTFTIGDIIWQEMGNAAQRIIDELRVYCHETGQIWEFDSDQLRSGTRDRDYSEVMDKYEDFTPPDNRPTDAYLYGWDGLVPAIYQASYPK